MKNVLNKKTLNISTLKIILYISTYTKFSMFDVKKLTNYIL